MMLDRAEEDPTQDTIRVLHSLGHLSRGGIETWLYDVVRRLHAPQFEHHVMVWTDQEEAFTADFVAAGARVHPVRGHTNPPLFARNFRDLLRREGPFQVLHTHGTQFHGLVLGLGRLAGIPTRLAHSHTDIRPVLRDSGRGYRAYARAGHAAIRRFATDGRAVSEYAAISMFGEDWRSDPRWQILYCGIDLSRFDAAPDATLRAGLGIPAGRFVLGHVGRFERQKNHAFLVDLLAALVSDGVDAHLLAVGDGTLRGQVLADLERRGLASRTTMLSDSRILPELMIGAMDVFLLPSLYEGLPLALVEAQAAGLACLVSDSVTAEATAHTGRVVRLPLADGAARWARAVMDLPRRLDARDADLRRSLVEGGFDVSQSAARLGRLYGLIPARAAT